jgi:general secretion pathway protein N
MMRRRTIHGLALGSGVVLLGSLLGLLAAAAAPDLAVDPGLRPVPRPPALGFDPPASDVGPSAPDIVQPAPGIAQSAPDTPKASPVARAGNPLWAIPLSALTVTRERPLFSSSRRPPPPAVVAAPVVQTRAPPPPKASEPERPRLSLVGTVAGDQGIAVFVDQATQAVVRLRTGEGHDGWVLRTVGGREVTLQNDRDTAILTLPRPDGR